MHNKPGPKISTKQRQIAETAEMLFMRHGIKRVTIEEICRKAGVSKMTFYKHFANKIDLLRHLWNNWVEEGLSKLDEISARHISFPDKVDLMFSWKEEFVSKMNTEFLEEFQQIDFELKRVKDRFSQIIVESQKRAAIRPEVRPEFIMAVLDKLYELARDKDLLNKYPSHTEFRRELKDFFWFGLLVRHNSESEKQDSTKTSPF